jgi:hypothetical protein
VWKAVGIVFENLDEVWEFGDLADQILPVPKSSSKSITLVTARTEIARTGRRTSLRPLRGLLRAGRTARRGISPD